MSEQFKVGDKVRFAAHAFDSMPSVRQYRWHVLTVTGVDTNYVHYVNPITLADDYSCPDWLELVPELKAEKALLVSRISEIDKQIEAEAQGDGLSRLKAIVEGTGYFRSGDAFFRYREAGGITEDDMVAGYYQVAVAGGYEFSAVGGVHDAQTTNHCATFPSDLEGWQSITMERFLRAKSDYESIVQMVKEAMEP